VTSACDACLRRGHLIGFLAPRIAALLDRPGRRATTLLGLPDGDLIDAVSSGEGRSASAFLARFDVRAARRDLNRRELRAVCAHSREYPDRLGGLTDAPAVLFVAGSAPLATLREPSVALIGARRATGYGREVAQELGRGLAVAGVEVVSGLALGIDAAAHRGSLAGGGSAVAVLAGGADVPYPRTNARLYTRIAERGLVVSELPPGQRPFRWSFPARNRIMAGLAEMTVVVEAAARSGSLITSDFAVALNRPVGAVPGQVTVGVAAGSNELLRDGAVVVTAVRDVLDELSTLAPGRQWNQESARPPKPPADLVERALLAAVEAGLGIDGICATAGLPTREARAGLTRLEIAGLISRDGLGGYRRSAGPVRPDGIAR